jgi:hypothetical protein
MLTVSIFDEKEKWMNKSGSKTFRDYREGWKNGWNEAIWYLTCCYKTGVGVK